MRSGQKPSIDNKLFAFHFFKHFENRFARAGELTLEKLG